MKRILGLDLGTNSIGWALVEIDHLDGKVNIVGIGSRILPMDAGEVKKYAEGGKIISTAAQTTEKRGSRRLNERYLLRRDRLHLVLNLLNALPEHYKLEIDFKNKKGKKCGQLKKNAEPKLAYLPKQKDKKAEFLFIDSYQEMLEDINDNGVKNEKGKRIPYDWTLYYLRKKALSEEIAMDELAWVLLSYNQKRGYKKIEALDEFEDMSEKLKEFGISDSIQKVVDVSKIEIDSLVLKVAKVVKSEDKLGTYFNVILENGYSYKEYSNKQITELNDKIDEVKIIERFTILNEDSSDNDTTKTIYKIEDIFELKVLDVIAKDTKGKYLKKYTNGWSVDTNYSDYNKFKRANTEVKEEIFLTRLYNEEGALIKPSKKSDSLNLNISKDPFTEFKLLDPNKASNWKLLKKKTEKEALQYNSLNGYVDKNDSVKNYISPNIYSILKDDAKSKTRRRSKIIGGMFQVVERDFYREELNQIIATQKKFHKNLEDEKLFKQCVRLLYPNNKNHARALENSKAIERLLVDDILLYQRPLKSKKSEIANCKYEIRHWKNIEDKNGIPIKEVDIETGELKVKKEPMFIKVVSASHPYFQEFRIWDKLHNLRLIESEKIDKETGEFSTNIDVTENYIKNEDDYRKLFNKLNNQKTLNQNQFLKFCKDEFGLPYDKKKKNFVWNFPEDEEIKGNETRVSLATRFKRCGLAMYSNFLTQEKERELWHYLYSVNYLERKAKDKKTDKEYKSITTFFNNYFKGYDINEEIKDKIVKDFINYPKFISRYSAYSEKALKKFLPLIRFGNQKHTDKWATEQWYIKWKESLILRQEEILRKLKEVDFNAENIDYDKVVKTNINLQNREIPFPKGLFSTFRNFEKLDDFTNLNLTKASYLIYGRHSELAFAKQWQTPKEIREELYQELKQHSLNNPIAEKVLLEMMQVVTDIWEHKKFGNNQPKYFSKIHLEVGRDLKKSIKEKEFESKRMSGNRAKNKRIRQVLEEFLANSTYSANPNNKDHFERLKIVEEGAEHRKNIVKDFFKDKPYSKKDIDEILKKQYISKADFEKYKLWIEQGYLSPYSGQMISLTELFDGNKYNIDHIFPQASITNNSLSNKVVVEVVLNELKSDKTARAFIQSQNGQPHLGIPVYSEEKFVSLVKKQFSGTKRYILLSKDIPKGFTNSQMNNTRHITRKAIELLSHIVREKGEVEFRSKNVLPVTGRVTTELKRAWKLNEVWKELVAPRFIRMNELTKSKLFGDWQTSKSGQIYFNCKLDDSIREKDESYDIKRIDHRHHALDALIVALCTEEHVNYINNINANAISTNYGKQKQIEKYRQTLKRKIKYCKPNKEKPRDKDWYFMKPGEIRQLGVENSYKESVINMTYIYKGVDSFGQDYKKTVLTALQDTIVTFKQSLRVINRTVNRYNNTPNKSEFAKQKGKEAGNKTNWAIRRSLGEDTYYGKVYLGETENKHFHKCLKLLYNTPELVLNNELQTKIIEIRKDSNNLSEFETIIKNKFPNKKVELKVYKIVVRKPLVYSKNNQFNREKIQDITDTGIQKILFNHLKQYDTVELPFEEAIAHFDALVEKHEFEAIINDNENQLQSIYDLERHLKENRYKYNKTNYTKLNVFIDKISERDFRNEKHFEGKIKEHPEIAFTPEVIEEMNKSENLKKLNGGKNHAPIRKVRISRGFGKQRALNEEDPKSVKSKQYVVNDAGSNLYLGFYERIYKDENGNQQRERKFKDIGLIDLIETLKQDKNNRLNPLPSKFYDDNQDEYNRIFTLSPLDLVYIPTEDEIEHPSKVDFNNLAKEQVERIYKYVDGNSDIANFAPFIVSKPIWRFHGKKNKELYKELSDNNKIDISEKELIQNEFGLGSQQNKNQNMIDGTTQIKKICWKLKTDRLGNITDIIK